MNLGSILGLGCLCRPFPAGFTNLAPVGLELLSCPGVPPGPSMEGAMLGAAFWHELPKMSGFVHGDSPRGQFNGPRLATTT